MATDAQYAAATAAVLGEEQQIIREKGVPPIFVPPTDILTQYATRIAKVALDAALAVPTNGVMS